MNITITNARLLFVALGFASAARWDEARCNKKFAMLAKIIDDPDEIDPDTIEDKSARKLFDEVAAAVAKGEEIVTVADDAAPAAKASKKSAKSKKPAKKAAPPVEDEAEDDADEESEDADEDEDEEEAPPPAKKSSKKSAKGKKTPPPAKKSAEKKSAAKKAPAAKKSTAGGAKDKWGAREGSSRAAINKVLSRKPQTTEEIVEASGVLKSTVQEHLWKLRSVDKVIDRNDKGWFVKKA